MQELDVPVLRVHSKECPTYRVTIYISGDTPTIRQVCQKFAYENSICISCKRCLYIWNGGAERGAELTLINYPKHPKAPVEIDSYARSLALRLLDKTWQRSCSIVTPTESVYIERADAPE